MRREAKITPNVDSTLSLGTIAAALIVVEVPFSYNIEGYFVAYLEDKEAEDISIFCKNCECTIEFLEPKDEEVVTREQEVVDLFKRSNERFELSTDLEQVEIGKYNLYGEEIREWVKPIAFKVEHGEVFLYDIEGIEFELGTIVSNKVKMNILEEIVAGNYYL